MHPIPRHPHGPTAASAIAAVPRPIPTTSRRASWLGALALALATAAGTAGAGTLEGTATYRERMLPPPGTAFEAVLEDTARAGAPALVLGRVRLDGVGAPPYAFRIEFDDAAVTPLGRYAVRTRLVRNGRLLWRSEPTPRVFADGVARPLAAPLAITMVRVASDPAPVTGALDGATPGPLPPGRFEGVLPTAAGPGQRWTLDLRAPAAGATVPGMRFELRTQHLSPPDAAAQDDLGVVRVDGDRLRLVGARGEPRWLARVDDRTLRLLDRDGRPVETALPMTLTRVATAGQGPMVLRLPLRGEFVAMADAPTIRLCADGRRLPVAFDGAYAALERAYTAARRTPGEAVLVEIDAEVGPRPSADPSAGRLVDTVVVRRVTGAWARETCGNPLSDSPLLGSYWKLVRLAGQAVPVADRQREPHLVLRTGPDGVRVAGHAGCNRIAGGATLEGDGGLAFGGTVATRMACAQGMDTEAAFLDALSRTQRYRLAGSHLDLVDAGGAVLARLEAVALR